MFWMLIGALMVLLLLRLWAGPAPARPADSRRPTIEPDAPADEPLWTAEALQKYGTPETAADLNEQGRADELRGLGYRGDVPSEERQPPED